MSNEVKLANPGPLGLWGFALTTWLLSMINAGWTTSNNLGMVLPMALVFGGTAQIIAGIFEFRKGNSFGFVAFISYGSFWWTWALFVVIFSKQFQTSSEFVGIWLFLWGVFTFVMFIASLAKARALQFVFFFLTLAFIALGLGDTFNMHQAIVAGGYFGLITAILAAYLASAETINESFGRDVLPLGVPKSK